MARKKVAERDYFRVSAQVNSQYNAADLLAACSLFRSLAKTGVSCCITQTRDANGRIYHVWRRGIEVVNDASYKTQPNSEDFHGRLIEVANDHNGYWDGLVEATNG